ncbi:MAG: hypothetical protein GY774_28665 [Planctomycetes bacterium]|nr:hypothetical protein [Planctomycetota bacterium]
MSKKLIYLASFVLVLSLVWTTVSARQLPVVDGLELRFDASAITGLAPGDSIRSWDDTSGNDRHAIGGDGGATYGEYMLHGFNTITFHDIYTESMAFDYSPNNKDITLIGVSRSRMQRSLMETDIEREGQGWPYYHKGYIAWGEVGGFGVTTPGGFHMDNTYIMLGGGPGMRWEVNYDHPELIEGFTVNIVRLNSITGVMDVYRNGEFLGERRDINHGIQNAMSEGRIAGFNFSGGLGWDGDVAEILVYSRALTDGEMEDVEEYMYNKWLLLHNEARRPVPADGAIHPDTWVSLSWIPGASAVSHDLFFGENLDDVNDGTGDTFRGNQAAMFYVAGFPGFAYPDGLVPGTTYYWRIDEVNDAEPNSPWKGDVWSFAVPPRIAYEPEPPDGSKFVDSNVTLSWTPGHDAKLHTVYLGDDFDTVSNATGGTQIGTTTYTPDILENEKTYYWRVDEYDIVKTHLGDVWSFTTAREGGGLRGSYYNWSGLVPPTEPFQTLVLERTDTQINFAWIEGSPDPSVDIDQFSVQWAGELEIPFSGIWTFYTTSDDGVRLWINGQLVVDNWTEHRAVENSGTIELSAGKYSLVMEYFEYDLMAAAQLWWQGPKTPKQVIPQGALSLPVKARSTNPSNGATGVKHTPVLTWVPGIYADSHEVYFGTDADAVKNADMSSPEYKGSENLGSESYEPGQLEWNTTYYWRVDEANNVNADSPWIGPLWSFTTANFLIIDDMESYNDIDEGELGSNRIYVAWMDGFDDPTNGSQIGNLDPPFAEQNIVHSGNQSMPFAYDNAVGKSEATLTLSSNRDWTVKGVNTLTIWFRGEAANAAETMYVVLNGSAAVDNPNPDATQATSWTEWNIDIQAFADQGVNLGNVTSITLGLGNRANPVAGGAGMMYFDDIRLYPPAP